MNKICTTIEQSKKLAQILPIESADFGWNVFVDDTSRILPINDWDLIKDGRNGVKFFHAWSLSALLNRLPVTCDDGRHCLAIINSNPNGEVDWLCCYEDYNGNVMLECYADNLIDVSYEMILKLHELNLL